MSSKKFTDKSSELGGTCLFVMGWDFKGVGGVTQVVSSLYRGVEQFSGLKSRLLVISWDRKKPVDELDWEGRDITHFRLRGIFYSGPLLVDLLRFLILGPIEIWEIRQFFKKHNVRVVNYHFVHAVTFTLALMKYLRLYSGKLIFSVHGLDLRTLSALKGLRRRLLRWALNNADAVVACSVDLAREVVDDFGVRPDRVVTIHNGVNIPYLKKIAANSKLKLITPASGPVFLNLGTFEFKKGHDILLTAFSMVLKSNPTVRLYILGRTGPQSQATAALLENLDLAGKVFLLSNVVHSDALAALREADIFVLPSRNEAFSVALLEAGAFGKPVIATNVCGVQELLDDGYSGLIIPPEDPKLLADAMERLLQDSNKARTLGENLYGVVDSKFSEAQSTRMYLKLMGV